MTEAMISSEVLRWARRRAAMPVDVIAGKLKVAIEKITAWEGGESYLTFHQAEKIATILHIPFGYLFLPSPPEEKPPLPDLRTPYGAPRGNFSADLLDLLRAVQTRHSWFRDYLQERGAEPLPFVGKFTPSAPVQNIAADIAETLGIKPGCDSNGTPDDFFKSVCEKCEDRSIWIMRSGIVFGNTHRPLRVSEFRGFAIADTICPLIFINASDAKSAQLFTLAHELAHIWLGQAGVSEPFLEHSSPKKIKYRG
jgi:transcriptional regulator with XRE-family HTH domain